MSTHYDKPNPAARAVNTVIRWLAELGVSISGTRVLRVTGRKSGKVRTVVINVLTVDGVDYVVSPRGNTQWARNVRAAGAAELGPAWRRRPVRLTEVADDAKPDLIRRYLQRWYWEVKGYVGDLTPNSDERELRSAAPTIPVFAVTG